ncbi:MAG: T9SS type A sorting domain-containing protein [Bacteroidetes bacterium]|nr:T9SS type A sorting domain-containing protein [Bacteroidota bacterium]
MKKYFFLLTFALCFVTFSFSQEYGWIDLSDNLPDNAFPITDIFFLNENEGWVTASSVNEIYHTTDGGLTFETQTTLQPSQTIYMLNELEGFAGGQSGAVHHTSDGGETWSLINNFLPGTIFSMSFPPDSDTGYICGNDGWVGKINSIHVFDQEKLVNANLYAISFPAKGEGWVCGGSIIRHYINGVWTAELSAMLGGYNAMHFIDAQNGWIGGDGGQLIHTSNGYDFETQRPYGSGATLNGIYAINPLNAWAVGYHYIIKTNDSGNTWALDSVPLGGSGTLASVFFLNKNLGYVSGYKQDDELISLPALFKYTGISAVAEGQKNTLSCELYPNPANDKLEVRSLEFGVNGGTIEIYDVNGRILIEKHIPPGNETIEIDVSSFEGGIYFCKLITEKGNATKKLIIQK